MADKNSAQQATFQCLRCGHRFLASYTPRVTEERSCPRCASNSIRHIK